jgi:hypothetical protein
MNYQDLDNYLDTLRSAGWTARITPNDSLSLPQTVLTRYPAIPESYLDFLCRVGQCSNAADNAWFLTVEDFQRGEDDDTQFRWNEWERMSVEAANDDQELIREVVSFWDNHIPIAAAVHSDYAYLAIAVGAEELGTVVYGHGPMFEDSRRKVAASFDEYLDLHRRIVAGEVSADYLDDRGQACRRREFSDFL